MKYLSFRVVFSGTITVEKGESDEQRKRAILDSFPLDLQAGVTLLAEPSVQVMAEGEVVPDTDRSLKLSHRKPRSGPPYIR